LLPFVTLAGCKTLEGYASQVGAVTASGVLTRQEMAEAIRQALREGVRYAVDTLGAPDGFLGNPAVRIPLPDELDSAAEMLRRLGQGRYVERFETTLNRAAEQAVSQSFEVFAGAVSRMSIEDAYGILDGPDDAATRYFRRETEAQLRERFRPIIERATAQSGVTATYKQLVDAIPSYLRASLNADVTDLDGYVLDRSMDALYARIGVEERAIREQPVQRTTELMRKVFGAFD
jgi:hypothetical protein